MMWLRRLADSWVMGRFVNHKIDVDTADKWLNFIWKGKF